jgi:hypothetical protein
MGNMLTTTLLEDTSIASRAMKAVFHRGMGASRRTRDTEAESLVKEKFGNEGQVVTRKLFIDKDGPIRRRATLANEMYNFHMKHTLPHGDDGSRLLPNSLYMDYTSGMSDFESRLRTLDAEILADYVNIVQQDIALRVANLLKQGKQTIAHFNEYPEKLEMERYLYVDWHLEPVPTASDFRYQVDETIIKRMDERLKQVEADATLSIFTQMATPMKNFADKLAVPIGEAGSIFRDSLIENLNELSFLRKMNVNNDPRITQLLSGIEEVIKPYLMQPDILREQPEARSRAKEKMTSLLVTLDEMKSGL